MSLINQKIKFIPLPNQVGTSQVQMGAGELFSILRRNMLSICCMVLIGLLGGTYYAFHLPNIYTVEAKVALEPSDSELFEAVPETADLNLNNETIATELVVIGSRQLAGRVVDELDLVNDPTFNPYLSTQTDQSPPSNIIAALVDRIRKLVAGVSGAEEQRSANDNGRVGRLLTKDEQRDRIINKLMAKTQVDRIGQSMVINIRVSDGDPRMAVEIANTVATDYLDLAAENRRDLTQRAIDFLTERANLLGKEVSEAEQRLADHVIRYRLTEEQLDASLRAEIEALRVQRQIALNSGSPSSNSDAEIIESELQAKQAMLSERQLAEIEQRQMERAIASGQRRYEQIITRLGNLDLQAEPLNPHGKILSYAQFPTAPSSPKRLLIIIAGAAAGSVLALLFTVLGEGLDNRVRNEEEVARITGIPIFGMIPEIKKKRWQTNQPPHGYLSNKPFSHYADAIRQVLNSCRGILPSGGANVILLTSCVQDEGKSTTALSMAFSAAREERRTVLLDTDFHKCGASKMAGVNDSVRSLDEVIAGKCTLEEAIYHHPDQPFLDVVGFSRSPRNVDKMAKEEAIDVVLTELREKYQLVLVDTAPVLLASSATFMAKFADLVVVMVRWGKTDKETLSGVLKKLQLFAAVPLGIAINRIDFVRQARLRYDPSAKYQAYADNYYYRN